MLFCWDKATLCVCVQSWMHTWCGQGEAGADLLFWTWISRKTCILRRQAELSLGSSFDCLEGVWSLKVPLNVYLNCHFCLVLSLPIISEMCKQKSTTWIIFFFVYTLSHFLFSNPQLATFFTLVQTKELMAGLFLFKSTLVLVPSCLVPQHKGWKETPLQLEDGALKLRGILPWLDWALKKQLFQWNKLLPNHS